MTEPKHILTIVEPVDFAEMARKQAQQKEKAATESDKSFVTAVLQKATVERIHTLLDADFDNNLRDFDELIKITEASKDMAFNEQSGDFIKYLEEHYPVPYMNHLSGRTSDHSGASNQDNR